MCIFENTFLKTHKTNCYGKMFADNQSMMTPFHHFRLSVCLSDKRLQHPAALCCSSPPMALMTPSLHMGQRPGGLQNAPCNVLLHLWIYGSSLSGWSAPTYSNYHLPCGHKQSGSVECQDKACWFQQDLLKCDSYIGIREILYLSMFSPFKLGKAQKAKLT